MDKANLSNLIRGITFVNRSGKKIDFKIDFERDTPLFEKLKEIDRCRGTIISGMIDVENKMQTIISAYFTEEIKQKSKLDEMVLSRPQITTMLKWKMFCDILKDASFMNEDDFKDLRRIIHELIEIRDNFAHGTLCFDMETREPFLQYYRDGHKELNLTAEYFESIEKKINDALKGLIGLNKQFTGKFET